MKLNKIKGANMDIDLIPAGEKVHWEMDKCPGNKAEKNNIHKCAVKNVSLCEYFRGIEYPDVVKCNYEQ